MLEDIQNELQAILGKYPECYKLEWLFLKGESIVIAWHRNKKDGLKSFEGTLLEVIEHLETKYPNR